MDQEQELKGRMQLNKGLAALTLASALVSAHYAYAASNFWQAAMLGLLTGWLCLVTINRTLKASVYASALVMIEVELEKEITR